MREGGRDAVWRGGFSVCVWTWTTSRLFWRPQEGHSTIVGPEQRAVVNEQCRCDGRGGGARRPVLVLLSNFLFTFLFKFLLFFLSSSTQANRYLSSCDLLLWQNWWPHHNQPISGTGRGFWQVMDVKEAKIHWPLFMWKRFGQKSKGKCFA